MAAPRPDPKIKDPEEERIVSLPNRARRTALPAILGALTLLAGLLPAAAVAPVLAVSPNIVISQVYGGGGNSGATYTHDFIELFNRGATPVNLSGWSVQYAAATGTASFGGSTDLITPLSGTLAPGQYLLVQEAQGSGGTQSLPTPDVTDSTPIAMSGTAGKVIVASTASGLGCNGGSTPCSAAQLAQIVDLIGYGGANFFEGAAAPTLANTTSASRAGGGCTDTDNNAADFTAGTVNPRNSASPLNPCAPVINEFVANHTGTDTNEFVEVFGAAGTNLGAYTVLQIEGDGTGAGVVDSVLTVGTTNAGGFWTTGFLNNALENGTMTLLLVQGFSGAIGNDLDTNNDGILDATPWTAIADGVAVSDGGTDDRTYATTTLAPGFGGPFTPGGASRIPNGIDTDAVADWTINDFDGAGIPGFPGGPGTPEVGEALNTPDATNQLVPAGDTAPEVSATSPANGATGVSPSANVVITFSEPVNVAGAWYSIVCGAMTHTATVSGGPTTFSLDPTTDFAAGASCTVTIFATGVSDQDANDPPDNMVADVSFSFSVAATNPCVQSYTPTYAIQGSGAAAAITGNVTTQGLVVGDFEGPDGIGGFYLQDLSGDGNAATSDGIFVYTGTADTVSAGQVVRVTGFARERFNQTAINGSDSNSAAVTAIVQCGTGTVAPVDVVMPFPTSDYLERFEGMLVRLPQALVISEYFNYDRFGELVLALPLPGETRPFTGTAIDEPGAPANARTLANSLRRITLDDGLGIQNPDVTRHPNGQPFSLANRFRGGDTVANTVGVLGFDFSLYRIQPTAPADYTAVNPRPAAPDPVGGSLRVAAMNTLNYFLTLDYPTGNPLDNQCGPLQNVECRGADADQPDEFNRQRAKLLAALAGLDADVIGLNEIENTTGVDPAGDIAGALPGYAAINTGTIGTDAIKVGLIYRPAAVTPIGAFKILDSSVDPRFRDNLNRPVLVQTFEENASGARFTVAVNHLKSKGSDCNAVGDPDTGDGQGNCNVTRRLAAEALVDWLATDPTGSGDADVLIIGDLNSYAQEDPIDAVKAGPDDTPGTSDDYVNLISAFQGTFAYSYVFDGQFGYLDHALANSSLASQVTGATDWHINADEPDLIDYDTSFKSPGQDLLYEPNGYRSSDHDSVIIGLDLNGPPTVSANGPYSVVEGTSVQVCATGSDPDGDTLSYAWDLDDNGSFETAGQCAIFSAPPDSAPETRTISVRATDPVGHTAVDSTTVRIIWSFTGFFSPISNPPAFNQVKAGSVVPVKFSLSGDQGLSILAAGSPSSMAIECPDGSSGTSTSVPTMTAGASGLTYDAAADQYVYTWKTSKGWSETCRSLVVTLDDGTVHHAYFEFVK